MGRWAWLVVFAVACRGSEETDIRDTWPDTYDPDQGDPCDELLLIHVGPDEPSVGDTWDIHLECDGAFMMGPYTTRITPSDLGRIDELNTAIRITWLKAGDGTIRMQAGQEVKTQDVTIAP